MPNLLTLIQNRHFLVNYQEPKVKLIGSFTVIAKETPVFKKMDEINSGILNKQKKS